MGAYCSTPYVVQPGDTCSGIVHNISTPSNTLHMADFLEWNTALASATGTACDNLLTVGSTVCVAAATPVPLRERMELEGSMDTMDLFERSLEPRCATSNICTCDESGCDSCSPGCCANGTCDKNMVGTTTVFSTVVSTVTAAAPAASTVTVTVTGAAGAAVTVTVTVTAQAQGAAAATAQETTAVGAGAMVPVTSCATTAAVTLSGSPTQATAAARACPALTVKQGDTCWGIATSNCLNMAQFYGLNPQLNEDVCNNKFLYGVTTYCIA